MRPTLWPIELLPILQRDAGAQGSPIDEDDVVGAVDVVVGAAVAGEAVELRQRVERIVRRAIAVARGVGIDVPDARGSGTLIVMLAGVGRIPERVVVVERVGEDGIAGEAGGRQIGEFAVRLDDEGAAGVGDGLGRDGQQVEGGVHVGGAGEDIAADGPLRAGRIGRSVGRVVHHERRVADRAVGPGEGEIGRHRRVVDGRRR